MKRKLLFAVLVAVGALGMRAQTDVTSTYLTNADFSQTTALDNHLCGYGKDMSNNGTTYYGFQAVDGWTSVVTNGDNSNSSYPNSAMGGAVFEYGSTYEMRGNSKTAPATNPDGEASGNCLGFFGVWGCGGYYYQEVTLSAGKYTINIPVYNQSGTQANTSYIGWIPNSGTSYTLATNPTVGSWTTLTTTFTLTDATTGKICLGYQSTGSGSGANAMLYFDKVQILYTAVVVKDVLSTAITAATNANATLNNSDLTTAIATAQGVYDNEDATQDEVNSAATTLNAATESAMSAVGDVTGVFLANPGFESCTAEISDVAAMTKKDYSSAGWTNASTGSYTTIAVTAYGGGVKVGNSTTPSTKKDGTTVSGNTLGIIAGWGDNVTIQSNDVTLPAGVYTFTVDHYLTSSTENYGSASSRFGFVTSSSSYLVSSTTFTASTWTTETVTFTLTESTTGKIQIGLTGLNKSGSGSPAIFYDDITITYKSFLAGAKEAWEEAVAAAEQAKTDYPNVTGEELTALNEELAKSEPTTVDGYNEATDALTDATDALVAAATSYNALVTVNGLITAAGTLEYADADKKPSAGVTATSASDATTKAASQYTALRAYYESHAMAEGVSGAEDYTSAVSAANADTNTGWTNGIGTNQGQGYTDADGNVASKYLDGGWASNAGANIDMTRSVEIPAGKYLLTVTARGANNLDTYTLSIGGETVNLPKNSNTGGVFNNGWDDVSVEFDADGTTQTLEVIANSTASQQWISINRFRLVCLEINNDAYAGETEYTALNSAISAAEAKTLGFENGEYAPYNNVAALEALATAKAIDQNAELTNLKTDVEAATTALTSATWTANDGDVDAIYNGLFATVTEGANYPDGWSRTNGWGQMQSGLEGDYATAYYNQPGSLVYGNTGVYTMPLAADTWYKLTFAYRSHESNSNNGVTASVLCNGEGLAATTFEANGSTTDWKVVEKYFYAGTAGDYVLTLANSGNTWMTGVSIVKETPANITLTSSVTLQGYKTFYNAELSYEVDDNTTIYMAAAPANGYVTLTEKSTDKIIPAGTPVILKTSNTTDYKMTLTPTATESGNDFEDNALTTVTAAGSINGYILAYKSGEGNGFGFWKYTGSDMEVGDVYLPAADGAKARLIIVVDGEATAINAIEADEVDDTPLYNLAGQRVNKGYKGIVIKKNAKYIMK